MAARHRVSRRAAPAGGRRPSAVTSGRLCAVSADDATDTVCSAKACRNTGIWVLAWNNPKIHLPERRKTWIACDDHLAPLTQFLNARGFLRETIAVVEEAADELPSA